MKVTKPTKSTPTKKNDRSQSRQTTQGTEPTFESGDIDYNDIQEYLIDPIDYYQPPLGKISEEGSSSSFGEAKFNIAWEELSVKVAKSGKMIIDNFSGKENKRDEVFLGDKKCSKNFCGNLQRENEIYKKMRF